MLDVVHPWETWLATLSHKQERNRTKMEIPTMNPQALNEFAKICFTNKETLLVTGPPGCAKTAVIKDAAREIGYNIIMIHLCVSAPIDAKGLPCFSDNPINGEKEADFIPFGDMRDMMDATKPTVVILDDFGTAPISVQTGYMQVVQERRLNKFPISEHVTFALITNRSQDKSGANQGVIETIKGRSVIVPVRADVDVWVDYVRKNGVADYSDEPYDACPPELMAFTRWVNSKSEPLFEFSASKNVEEQTCTPRNLSRMGRIINRYADIGKDITKIPLAVLHGTVGSVVGTKLAGFSKTVSKLPPIKDILADPQGTRVPTEPNECYALIGFLANKTDMKNMHLIVPYVLRISTEFRVLYTQDIATKKALRQHDSFKELLQNTKIVLD